MKIAVYFCVSFEIKGGIIIFSSWWQLKRSKIMPENIVPQIVEESIEEFDEFGPEDYGFILGPDGSLKTVIYVWNVRWLTTGWLAPLARVVSW